MSAFMPACRSHASINTAYLQTYAYIGLLTDEYLNPWAYSAESGVTLRQCQSTQLLTELFKRLLYAAQTDKIAELYPPPEITSPYSRMVKSIGYCQFSKKNPPPRESVKARTPPCGSVSG